MSSARRSERFCRRVMTSSIRFTIFCLVTSLFPTSNHCQRTYERSCECEKTVNGKCAYTLVLPVGEGAGPEGCKGGCSSKSDDLEVMVNGSLKGLSLSLDALEKWTGEQAKKMISLDNKLNSLEQKQNWNDPVGNGTSDFKALWRNISEQASTIRRLENDLESVNKTVTSFIARVSKILGDKMDVTSSAANSSAATWVTPFRIGPTEERNLNSSQSDNGTRPSHVTTKSHQSDYDISSGSSLRATHTNDDRNDATKSPPSRSDAPTGATVRGVVMTTVAGIDGTSGRWKESSKNMADGWTSGSTGDRGQEWSATRRDSSATSPDAVQDKFTTSGRSKEDHQTANMPSVETATQVRSHPSDGRPEYQSNSSSSSNSTGNSSHYSEINTTTNQHHRSDFVTTPTDINNNFTIDTATRWSHNSSNKNDTTGPILPRNNTKFEETTAKYSTSFSNFSDKSALLESETTTNNKPTTPVHEQFESSSFQSGASRSYHDSEAVNNPLNWTTGPHQTSTTNDSRSSRENETAGNETRKFTTVNDSNSASTGAAAAATTTTTGAATTPIHLVNRSNVFQSATMGGSVLVGSSASDGNRMFTGGPIATEGGQAWSKGDQPATTRQTPFRDVRQSESSQSAPKVSTAEMNHNSDVTIAGKTRAVDSMATDINMATDVTTSRPSKTTLPEASGSTAGSRLRRRKRNIPVQDGSFDSVVDSLVSRLEDLEKRLRSWEVKGRYLCQRRALLVAARGEANLVANWTSTPGIHPSDRTAFVNGWCLDSAGASQQFVQIDFNGEQKLFALMFQLTGPSTGGHFYLSHSESAGADQSRIWNVYKNPVGMTQMFPVSNDADPAYSSQYKQLDLWQPITARSVRIHPVLIEGSDHQKSSCFSVDVIGCRD